MNKTVTVNIGGIVFHIDEIAYDKLRGYLEAIRNYFRGSDGSEEIVQDIESRIAEMLQEKIKTKQVVILTDINEVINAMGRPEDFAEGEEGTGFSDMPPLEGTDPSKKRLFRDPDDQVIGGVCSGAGAYLGIDPIWLRIGFLVAFFVFGSGLLLYLILWIIMPEAKTTAEKLQMKGEHVNISNIEKSFKDEMGGIKSKFDEFGKEVRRPESFPARFLSMLGTLAKAFLTVLGKVIAVFFVVIGLVVFSFLMIMLFSVTGVVDNAYPWLAGSLFATGTEKTLGYIAAFLVIGIPFLALVYTGLKMLLNFKSSNKLIGSISTGLFIFGVVLAFFTFNRTISQFSNHESIRDNTELAIASDTLYLQSDRFSTRSKHYNRRNFRIGMDDDFFGISESEDHIKMESLQLDIVRSVDGKVSLEKIYSANGKNNKEALANAKGVEYGFSVRDSLIYFDPYLSLDKAYKFRNQRLQLVLRIPVGKVVYLDESIRDLIYDIDNVTNTYDGKMIGHMWIMRNEGLTCLDCNFSNTNKYYDDDTNINAGDTHIRINEHGIDIKADGEEIVKIDSKGVRVNAGKKNNTTVSDSF
jgi:phage shock protein PspC (stress-responsive transcriptional regulator)